VIVCMCGVHAAMVILTLVAGLFSGVLVDMVMIGPYD